MFLWNPCMKLACLPTPKRWILKARNSEDISGMYVDFVGKMQKNMFSFIADYGKKSETELDILQSKIPYW